MRDAMLHVYLGGAETKKRAASTALLPMVRLGADKDSLYRRGMDGSEMVEEVEATRESQLI